MSSRIAIVGAKGGVGKTTIALNIGCVLAQGGRQVTLVDGDLHTPHVAINLGHMRPSVSVHDVLASKAGLKQSLYVHGSGLRILPGSIAYDSISSVSYAQFTQLCDEFQSLGELVLIDAPSGFGPQLDAIIQGVDGVLIVTAPDLASQADALKSVLRAREYGKPVLGLIINHAGASTDVNAVSSFVGVQVMGLIPRDEKVVQSQGAFHPVVMAYPDAPSARACMEIARSIMGGWRG